MKRSENTKRNLDKYVDKSVKPEIPKVLPAIPLRSNLVIYPNTVMPFLVGREKSLIALEKAMEEMEGYLFVVSQKDISIEDPKPEDLYEVGTVVKVLQIVKLPDETYKVLVEGLRRAKISGIVEKDELFVFEVEILRAKYRKTKKLEALMRKVREYVNSYFSMTKKLPQEALLALEDTTDPDRFADFVASMIPAKLEFKQELLETVHPVRRLEKILSFLMKELEIVKIEEELDKKVREKIEKSQKEYFLREKLRAIREELEGEEDPEIREFRERIEKEDLPDYVKEKAMRELKRLEKMSPYSPEATVVRTYLDWILSLPWNVRTEDRMDMKKARRILERNHYGLEKVKERILEFLAVRRLAGNLRAPILCLVGPPGVGKTSLGRSLAEAMNRRFVRMSLGGLRDEAEIKGHRRTYVGAMPGRILQLIRRAGTKNPVILLDEVDKMGVSFQGDPAAALLEVLDPEQNCEFVDNYLEIPFDLSEAVFVVTANVLYTIPPALKDRMEIIEIPGYTDKEKYEIAKGYLIPRILKEYGLSDDKLRFTPASVKAIISDYTREAGVRNLARSLEKIARKSALRIIEGFDSVKVSIRNLEEFLGPPPFKRDEILKKPEIGVATGLAWTPYGGTVILVESVVMPGRGELVLTGQLGDVMRESARIALSLSRKICGVSYRDVFENNDIHVHVPEGAVPKDGPSAGVTMVTSIISAITRKMVRNDLAMTGEITLRGRILPVGGVKEKIMAAARSGLKTVVIPKDNEVDLKEIPKDILRKLEVKLVDSIDEILEEVILDDEK